MIEQYKASGIWTMDTQRSSCVVPEQPLLINEKEEWRLNQLALTAWRAIETLTDWANDDISEAGQQAARFGANFPDGLTMPPAVRIDVVRTEDAPKIVEIDPISALSLGETIFLIDAWKEAGYSVPDGLLDAITQQLDGSPVSINLPKQKQEYVNEVNYLKNKLAQAGIGAASIDDNSAVDLSSFSELASSRRSLNKNGLKSKRNPLWGSLYGLSGKSNLSAFMSADKIRLPDYLPRMYTRDELLSADASLEVIAKPENGTGSTGVTNITASQAMNFEGNWSYQELLNPITDDFGIEGDWVSRMSIYAGRAGLLGAQITARQREGSFTNVHGQSDAIQTTIAIK